MNISLHFCSISKNQILKKISIVYICSSHILINYPALHKSDIIVLLVRYCPARAIISGTSAALVGFLVSEGFVEAVFADFEARCGLSYGQSIADMGSGLLQLWP